MLGFPTVTKRTLNSVIGVSPVCWQLGEYLNSVALAHPIVVLFLGLAVSTQRRQYRLLSTMGDDTDAVPLSLERAKKLEDIGFEWSAVPSSHKSWDGRYEELCDFVVGFDGIKFNPYPVCLAPPNSEFSTTY